MQEMLRQLIVNGAPRVTLTMYGEDAAWWHDKLAAPEVSEVGADPWAISDEHARRERRQERGQEENMAVAFSND